MIKHLSNKNSILVVILTATISLGLSSTSVNSFAQNDTGMMDNSTMMNATLAFAQEGNQTMGNMTSMEMTGTEETEEHEEYEAKGINVRDSVTLLLQDTTIPSQDYIHLYDSTPYKILNGHVAIKFPCDDQSVTPIKVLIGSAPNLTAAEFENIPELSTPGDMCLYHVDLVPGGNVTIITDVALQNPTDEDIEFPETSTVVLGVNQVAKGEHEGEHGEEEA